MRKARRAALAAGVFWIYWPCGAGAQLEQIQLPAVSVSSKTPAQKGKAPGAAQPPVQTPSAPVPEVTADSNLTETTAGPVEGYRALTAVSATKTDAPIEQVPQSIQVVPRSLIDDQQVLSVDEAARNVSGASGTPRLQTPAFDSGRIRGFFAEQRLDGLPTTYGAGHRDGLANIERIEVLKGPNAVLYGGGLGAPVGGTLNVISKLPTERARAEFGGTIGSDAYYRSYFDVNRPGTADGSVLFRMTGEYLDAGSFVDNIETEAFAINPTFAFRPNSDTSLVVQGRLSRWQQPEYQGLPAVGTVAGTFRIDRDTFLGATDAPDSRSDMQGVTATLDHAFSPNLDATIKARWTGSALSQTGQAILGSDGLPANVPVLGPSTWFVANALLTQEQDELALVAEGRWRTSETWHESVLLFGADYSRVVGHGDLLSDAALGGAGLVDLATPVFATPYQRPPNTPFTALADADVQHVVSGLYVQWTSTVADRVHVLGGLRLANLAIEYFDLGLQTSSAVEEFRVLPRLGALVDLTSGLSVYANYSEGLTGHHIFTARGLPDPEFSKQHEMGLKFDLGSGLSGTAAVFQIDRAGVPVVVDALVVGKSIERARGFEFDAIWQPSRNLSVIGSYAYTDARVEAADVGVSPGARRIGVPEHSARLWMNYEFDTAGLEGLSLGLGAYAASEQAVDLANLFFTDAYMTVDAKVAYKTNGYTISMVAKNVLDEEYFTSFYYLGGRVAAGEARSFFLTVSSIY